MVDPARRRRPVTTAKGEQTRAAILRAAAPIFARHGYRGASLASVADAVGLTQPGLLHHFPSKEILLLALLEDRFHADGRVLENRPSEEGLRLLEALTDIVRHNERVPEVVQLFAVVSAEGITPDHPAHEHFVQRYRKVRQRMARDLRAGQASGEIRDDLDAKLLAAILIAVMDGLQNQWLLDDEVDMSAAFELFCDLLVRSLASQPHDAPTPSSEG